MHILQYVLYHIFALINTIITFYHESINMNTKQFIFIICGLKTIYTAHIIWYYKKKEKL